VCFSSILVQNQ